MPDNYLDIIWKAVLTLLTLAMTLLANRTVSGFLSKHIKDSSHRQTLRMLLRNGIYILAAITALAIWLGFGSSFTVAMGILGAGIAFASQEVIGSLAGYVNILTGNLYRISDRVRIGDVAGDVLDISLMRTLIMEVGEWVQADQYTGRIVSVANRSVFSSPVINYTQHWPFLWDELMIPISYDSNWQKASEIILQHGQEYSETSQAAAKAALASAIARYSALVKTSIEPQIYLVMTDNWIEVTLRYVVDPLERRSVKGNLHLDLLRHFGTEDDITVASATFEIVGFPPLSDNRSSPSTA